MKRAMGSIGVVGFSLWIAMSFSVKAEAFEVVSVSPKANRKMTAQVMIDIERQIGANRWVAGRDCSLKVDKRLVERRFLRGSYNADVLFLNFETAHLGPRKAQAIVSLDSKWGSRLATDPEFGPSEDIRIELGDQDSTWIQYRHTGSHLVQFEIGNIRGLALCMVR